MPDTKNLNKGTNVEKNKTVKTLETSGPMMLKEWC